MLETVPVARELLIMEMMLGPAIRSGNNIKGACGSFLGIFMREGNKIG